MSDPAARTVVLVDVDGTLVDTNFGHAVAWWRAFRDGGISVPVWRLHRLIGMGADQLVKEIVGEERPDLEDAWAAHFEEFKDEATALPGARDLIRTLSERGASVVLATAGKAEDVEHFRAIVGADEWVDHEVNSSEVDASKPAPDIFRLALERAGGTSERTLVVGDTVWDVKAASACDLGCVGVLTGGVSAAELRDAGALAVYTGVAELTAELEESPIGALLDGR